MGAFSPRLEFVALAVVLLCGAAQRFGAHDNMAVEHFDEGVYASNIWFDAAAGHQYPLQHLYAPPLFPALVEWVMLLFGVGAAMLINPLIGTLTIAVVWWVTRSWCGPLAGIVAAALCATSEFHITYSRTLLTDPLLCLWLLAAVYCLAEAHRRLNARWMIAGGIFTALAWWTKYNGWLPLAIQAAGIAGYLVFGGGEARKEWKRHLAIIVGASVFAFVLWSPFPHSLRNVGGYAAVAENHRGYLVGLAGWGDSFFRQLQAHWHFDGFITAAGVAFAVLLVGLFMSRHDEPRFRWADFKQEHPSRDESNRVLWIVTAAFAVLLAGMSVTAGSAVLLGMLAVVGIGGWLWGRKDRSCEAMNLPGWMLAAWFVALLVATPMYRAYPRLTLPWLVSTWIGTGVFAAWAVSRLGERTEKPHDAPRIAEFSKRTIGGLAVVGLVLMIVFGRRALPTRFPAWQDRTGMQTAAQDVLERVKAELPREDAPSPFAIYVQGEPALFHHLSALRGGSTPPFYVIPVAQTRAQPLRVDGEALPTFLVTGPHAHRSESFEADLQKAGANLQPVGPPLPYRASDLVLLNEYSAREIQDAKARPRLEVRVFRVR